MRRITKDVVRYAGYAGVGALMVMVGCIFGPKDDDDNGESVPNYHFSGTVTDAYGNPVAGAVVTITNTDVMDTTDSFGMYSLIKDTAAEKGKEPRSGDSLHVVHPMHRSQQQALVSCTTDIDLQLQYNPDSLVLHGEPMRIIKPAGGETYHYGDTIQMIWMFDSDSTDQMVMSFASAPPIFYYEYIEDELDYIQWPEDTAQDSDNAAELTLIEDNPKRVLVRYPIAVKDTVVGFGVINFEDSLSIKVWDPYGQEGGCRSCQEGVFIDSPIYISREQ